jgi:hypothetical protein
MDLDNEIRKGNEARQLLEHPLLKAAFQGIESGLVEGLKRVPMGDVKTQQDLVLTLQLLGKLKSHFLQVMDTGKLAAIQKESLAKRVLKAIRN